MRQKDIISALRAHEAELRQAGVAELVIDRFDRARRQSSRF